MDDKKYFLGSYTSSGFSCSLGTLLSDTSNTSYILKGPPGSGKSALIQKISDSFPDRPKQLFFCAEDPNSLDAVYFEDIRLLIADGTAPHTLDPSYPKAVQSMIDLGAYTDADALRSQRDEIIALTDECAALEKRCRLCLSAIAPVAEDVRITAFSMLDRERLAAFAARSAKRLIPKGTPKSAAMGKTYYRCISALTPNGYKSFIPKGCSIILIDDDSMTASDIFIGIIAGNLVKRGFDVICGECTLAPAPILEQLIVPELETAFITLGFLNNINVENIKKSVSLRRFYDCSAFDEKPLLKKRIRFGKKAAAELMGESVSMMAAAKDVRGRLKEIYSQHTDFDGINTLAGRIIAEIS